MRGNDTSKTETVECRMCGKTVAEAELPPELSTHEEVCSLECEEDARVAFETEDDNLLDWILEGRPG